LRNPRFDGVTLLTIRPLCSLTGIRSPALIEKKKEKKAEFEVQEIISHRAVKSRLE